MDSPSTFETFGHLDAGTTKVMPGPRTKGTPGEHEFGGQPGNEGLLSTLRSFY